MLKVDRNMPSAEDRDRAGRLREVIDDLSEANRVIPVIVEGKKDAAALKKLGLEGNIIILHRGVSMYEFCEDIAETFPKVILLTDWDEKGEMLHRSLMSNLRGHCEDSMVFRGMLKILCQKDIKDIEGIPKLLGRLEGPLPMELNE
jgi:5S rRNA maturation endonuclease (ribonuclease M5)